MLYTDEQIEQACMHDPAIGAAINAMVNMVLQNQITPSELRACANHAAVKAEQIRTQRYRIP